jgi:hypothetical protein
MSEKAKSYKHKSVMGVNAKFANILRNYARNSGLVVNKSVDLSTPDSWLEPDIFIVPKNESKESVISRGKNVLLRAIAGNLSGRISDILDSKSIKKGIVLHVLNQGRAHQEINQGEFTEILAVRRLVVDFGTHKEMVGIIKFSPSLKEKGQGGKVSFELKGVAPLEYKFSDFGDIENNWDVSSAQLKSIISAIGKAVEGYSKSSKERLMPEFE